MQSQAVATPARPYSGFEMQFINGAWRPGRTGHARKDTDPYTGETLVEIIQADRSDLDEAYNSAAKAQAAWAAMLPGERAGVMSRAARILEARLSRNRSSGEPVADTGSVRL